MCVQRTSCQTCKASGKVGKDLTRKVNADPDTDPEGMQRTNGSSYVCGPCYNFILSWRKEEEYRSQATRKTRAQTSRARHPMPVASRASRATEVDALAADGERPRNSALIVVISLTALSLLGTHEPRTRSRLRSGTQNTGGAAEDAEQEIYLEIDTMDQEEGGGSVGLPHEDQTEKEEEEEDAMDVGDVVVTVIMGLSSLRAG